MTVTKLNHHGPTASGESVVISCAVRVSAVCTLLFEQGDKTIANLIGTGHDRSPFRQAGNQVTRLNQATRTLGPRNRWRSAACAMSFGGSNRKPVSFHVEGGRAADAYDQL